MLAVEALEDRVTPAVTASLNAGLLTVTLGDFNDTAIIAGVNAGGTTVRVTRSDGNTLGPFAGVTAITVVDGATAATQTQQLTFQDEAGGRISLTGDVTVGTIEQVVFANPTNPLAAANITVTGAQRVTQTTTVPQVAAAGNLVLSATAAGNAIGTPGSPLRVVTNPVAFLATDTTTGNGDQFFHLGGGFVNVDSAAVGGIDAGTGTVTLTNGQFYGNRPADFGDATTFNLAANSFLTVQAVQDAERVGGLTGAGVVASSRNNVHTLAVGGGNVSSTFNGVIKDTDPQASVGSGTIALRKTGTGTFTLTGANTYTGATTVLAGTLILDGSLAGTAPVAVVNNANGPSAFGGSGTTTRPVTVEAGAAVLPGDPNTFGTLAVGGVAFAPGAVFGVKVGGPAQFDRLAVTGSVDVSGARLFIPPTGTVLPAGGSITILTNDGADPVVGRFANAPGGVVAAADGTRYRVNYAGGDGNDVTLSRAPAPLPPFLLVTGPTDGTGQLFIPANGQYGAGRPLPLAPGFTGELHVALGDVNGDRFVDNIVGSGPGASGVRVLSGADGSLLAELTPFPGYAGGVFVAAGDLTGDGIADIAVTPDAADAFSGPVSNQLPVRVYSGGGFALLAAFDGLASLSGASGQGNPDVKLGGRPAIADVNGDGLVDLLVAAGSGGGPRVTAWSGTGFAGANGGKPTANPIANLFVFESTQRGGAFITAGDVNGDGFAEVIVGGGPGGGPRVRIVNARLLFTPAVVPNLEGVNLDDAANLRNGLVLNNFFAGSDALRGGVRVAARDLDNDNLADVVVGSGTNERSGVRVYRAPALAAAAGSSGEPAGGQTFDPFGSDLPGGVWIG